MSRHTLSSDDGASLTSEFNYLEISEEEIGQFNPQPEISCTSNQLEITKNVRRCRASFGFGSDNRN